MLPSHYSPTSLQPVLILTFGPISGAHFNPVVTISDAAQGGISWCKAGAYIAAQILGAFIGVAVAHLMFTEPIFSISHHARAGGAQVFSEFIATFGLVLVIRSVSRTRSGATPFAVGAYITAADWFTASTSFANPAVTVARSVSDTFAGIRPVDAPGFIVAQLIGAATATAMFQWLLSQSENATQVKPSANALDGIDELRTDPSLKKRETNAIEKTR